MLYRVELLADAESDLAALPVMVQRQILRKLEALALDPTPPGVKVLRGTASAPTEFAPATTASCIASRPAG